MDSPEVRLLAEQSWRASIQAECLAEWLAVGVTPYKEVLAQLEACEDLLSKRGPIAVVLQTLVDHKVLPEEEVLEVACTVFGREVFMEELWLLYIDV